MNRLFVLALVIFQLGVITMASERAEDPSLTAEGVSRELARHRATAVSDLRYRLQLDLRPGASRISRREEITLKLSDAPSDLILDFRDVDSNGKLIEGSISNGEINGRAASDLRQTSGHIVLPARYFNPGENTIKLDFETGVAPAGRPIIRYKDADDGSEYLYTLFVPMDASLAFPCFDQPDLKARFTLSVAAPTEWTVAANAPTQIVTREGANSFWNFKETPPISTYLFAFAAGPFRTIEGQGSDVPTRLYVRKSKFSRAQEEWPEAMKLTHEGLKHFVDFFGHPFPFTKYDQVLIPGFAYGGMEHAGATFLREDSILFRTVPTKNDKLSRASLILHELAHQ